MPSSSSSGHQNTAGAGTGAASSSSTGSTLNDGVIQQIRNGDSAVIFGLLRHPEIVTRASDTLQKSLFGALLGVIGDNRGIFTTGVKKESAEAMRLLTGLMANPNGEIAANYQQMLQRVGVDEIRKLRLDRHVMSSKTDVGPSALEFIRTVVVVLCVRPGEFLEQETTITRVEEALGSQVHGMLARSAAADRTSRRRRSHTQPPGAAPNTAAQERRNRPLPTKCKGEPRPPFNPLYRGDEDCFLIEPQSPGPVLFFAKHFGLGCVPNFGGWSDHPAVPSEALTNALSGYKPAKQGAVAAELVGAQQQQAGAPAMANTSAIPPPTATQRQTDNSPTNTAQQQRHVDPTTENVSGGSFAAATARSGIRTSDSPTQLQPQPSDSSDGRAVSSSSSPPPPSPTGPVVPSRTATRTPPASSPSPASTTGPSTHFALPPALQPGTRAWELLQRYLTSEEGVVLGWGTAKMGELGSGRIATLSKPTPRVLPLVNNTGLMTTNGRIVRIAGGSQFSLMSTYSGQVFSTGAGEWGQLGIGDPAAVLTEVVDNEIPVRFSPSPIKGFKSHDRIGSIAAGYAFAVALSHKGEIYLWGNNNHGQCSVGSKPSKANIRMNQPIKVAMKGSRIISVACGSFFVVALTDTHVVLSWGLVSLLGLGPEDEVVSQIDQQWIAQSLSKERRNIAVHPCKVSSLDGKKIVKVVAGQWHIIGVGGEGTCYSWGIGHQGRLGHGGTNSESRPKRIAALKDIHVVDANCGSFHTAFVTAEGGVLTCGDNGGGQCGHLNNDISHFLVPTKVNGFGPGDNEVPVVALTCGREHTTILTCEGEVFVFGSGSGLGLGLGTRQRVSHPRRIMTNFLHLSVSCGVSHGFSLALRRNIEVLSCGTLHAGGQCMLPLTMPDGLVSAALGASFTVLLDCNGDLSSFGNGDWGQLGLGPIAKHPDRKLAEGGIPYLLEPKKLTALKNHKVCTIAAGYAFAYAITENHQVFFWGNNNHCQSGLGIEFKTHLKVDEPKEIATLTKLEVAQIACGSFFVVALTTAGEVYGWGLLDCCGVGELKSEDEVLLTTSSTAEKRNVVSAPVRLEGLAGITAIATGQWHSVALSEQGALFTWGIGHQGRLGHGNTNSLSKPTRIAACGTSAIPPFVSVDCGSFNSCAISSSGQLFMWGDNESGQCGLEGHHTLLQPTAVASGVRTVACGRQHTVLTTHHGEVLFTGVLQHEGQLLTNTSFAFPAGLFGSYETGAQFNGVYYAVEVYSGPHHVVLVAERDRPTPDTVTAASLELGVTSRRQAQERFLSEQAESGQQQAQPSRLRAQTTPVATPSPGGSGGVLRGPQFPVSPTEGNNINL